MRIQKLLFFLFFSSIFLTGCTTDDHNPKDQNIPIGHYMFVFPPDFKLVPRQGLDSQLGDITNGKMKFSFDYGYFTNPRKDLPSEEYEVTEENFDGHFLQIVRPLNHQNKRTSIYLHRLADVPEEGEEYNRLTMELSNLTLEEQELAISVFRSVSIVTPE